MMAASSFVLSLQLIFSWSSTAFVVCPKSHQSSVLVRRAAWGGNLAEEASFAADLVCKAVNLCWQVQEELAVARGDTSLGTTIESKDGTKIDGTPVTAADFTIQAYVSSQLADRFPDDAFMGEEDASEVRQDASLLERCKTMANLLDSDFSTPDDESFLASIDRGVKSPQPNQRVWILDPIDGTKGLITGKQYIVGLALTNPFGKTMVAVMGNPGVTPQVMAAVKGHGLRYWNAETGEACIELERKIPNNWHLNRYDFTKLLPLTESSNLGWGSDKSSVGVPGVDYPPFLLSRPMSVGSPLPFGPLSPPSEICCGAQVKYFAVARGDVAGFIQFQQDQLKSWDHAPGVLCVQESGGIAQDADGNEILFTGREFKVRKGIVCCAAETDTMTRQRFIECVEQTDITTV